MAVAMETIDTAQKWESNIVMRDEKGPTPWLTPWPPPALDSRRTRILLEPNIINGSWAKAEAT